MGLTEHRRWRNRTAVLAAVLGTVLAVSWLWPPADAALAAFTRRLVTAAVRVEPVLVTEHFLLQAVACQERFGLQCAAIALPARRGLVARRPSILPANATSRSEARREISEGLGSPSAWLRAARAGPGAALHTIRYVTSQGWEAWAVLALSMATALTLLFWLVDSAFACVVLTPVVAIGVSWSMAAAMQALQPAGWLGPFAFLAALVMVVAGYARERFDRSTIAEWMARRRWKRRLAEGSLDD